MYTSILNDAIGSFHRGSDLNSSNAQPVLDALINESDEALMTSLFRAWDEKGIAEEEIYLIARILRDRCTKVRSKHEIFVDIVGTGGSRAKTFNVSTAAAFIIAGAGLPVAKHGNKAATSNSGSADVLSILGVEPSVDRETAERCLNDIGICFMFAPNFHRLSPTLGKVRRELGFPTIFNCVGPLCNPASAPHQVIGVWSEEMVPKIAQALARLGTKRSWVVHGLDGLDEISLNGKTIVAEVEHRQVKTFTISPESFSVESLSLDTCRTGSAEESAAMIRSVLSGDSDRTAARSMVLLNAAAGVYVARRSNDLNDCLKIVTESIESGAAMAKLDCLAEMVRK